MIKQVVISALFMSLLLGCVHQKAIKVDPWKATINECEQELEKRLSLEALSDMRFQRDEHSARTSVYYGETRATVVDIKIDVATSLQAGQPVPDAVYTESYTNQLKQELIQCYDSSVSDHKEAIAFSLSISSKDTLRTSYNHGIGNKLQSCVAGHLYWIMDKKIDYSIKYEVSFTKKNDVAQAFEVALDRGYKDIASCFINNTKDKKDISRMVVPLISYLDMDMMFELLSKEPDMNEPYPCEEQPGGFCYPLLKCIESNNISMGMECVDFMERFVSLGANIHAKNGRGSNAIILMMNKSNVLNELIERQKEKINLLIKNGAQPTKLYFPISKDIDYFINEWFTLQLFAMKENSIYEQSATPRLAFRFLWLRSFNKPVVIRINELENQKFQIVAKIASGKGGYDPGEVEKEITRELTDEEAKEFLLKAKDSNFWNAPEKVDRLGLDGAEWVFEGSQDGKYHMLVRWSPENNDAFRILGLLLIKMSGFTEEHVY